MSALGVSPRILVVEDEEVFGSVLCRVLGRYLCDATLTTTLRDAKSEIDSGPWSAFFVDVGLPDGPGTRLLACIRALNAGAPIILMSGGDPGPASREAIFHRAMFVAKPIPSAWFSSFRGWLADQPPSAVPPPPHSQLRPTRASLDTRLDVLGLSTRERQVFSELASGATAETVALRLGVSAATVRSHCHRVYVRLGAGSLTEVLAMANGWP